MFERLRALPARGKLLAIALLAAACGAVALALLVSRDASVQLFPEPLLPEQVSEVVERLAAWSVAFVPLPDNIRVEAKQRNELLLRLSIAGVPHPHTPTSEEVFRKAGPLTPQSVLDGERRAGLAGDLQLALRGVAGIEDARVILPDERADAFGDESTRPSSASVRLAFRPGAIPSRETLAGIRAFVAAAVTGLDAQRVALLDDRGVPLSDAAGSDQASDLQASLQSALDTAFGSGATIVRVRIAYDGRSHDVHDARREPLGPRSIVAAKSDERYSNVGKHYVKSSVNEDHGSAIHDEHSNVGAGAIERISVAVLVDETRHLDVAKIQAVAAAAIGLQTMRGDIVSVEAVPFRRSEPSGAAATALTLGYASTFVPLFVLAVAVLLALRIVLRPILELASAAFLRPAEPKAIVPPTGMPPAELRAALEGEPAHTVAAVLCGLPAPIVAQVLEMYDGVMRPAIVGCMRKPPAPIARDAHALLGARP